MPNPINVDDLIGYFKSFTSAGSAPTQRQKQRALAAAGPEVYQQARQSLMTPPRQEQRQQSPPAAENYPPAIPVGVAPNRYDNRQPNRPQSQSNEQQPYTVNPRYYLPAGTAYIPPGAPVGLMPRSDYYVLQGQPGPVYYDRRSGRPVPAPTMANNARGV